MRTLLDIARKDALVISRDKTAVLILLAMPMALVFILGSALGGATSGPLGIKVAIVNEDRGATGQRFVDGLTGAAGLRRVFDISVRADAVAVRRAVERGDLTAAVIIPADLTARVTGGTPAQLEVLQDPGSKVAAGIWAGVVRAAVAQASAQVIHMRMTSALAAGSAAAGSAATSASASADAVQVSEVKARTTKRISMVSYYAAGMTAMFLLFGSMFGAFAFVTERREQTLARIMAAPVSKIAIVGGKSLGVLMVGVGQLAVLLAGTRLAFGVDWGAHAGATVVLGVAEVIAAAGMAMALAALGKTERAIGAIGPASIMLFAATGGSMIPVEALPAWLRPLQAISPAYWTLGGFLDVMRGADLAQVVWRAGLTLVIGVVLFAFGVWRLRYE